VAAGFVPATYIRTTDVDRRFAAHRDYLEREGAEVERYADLVREHGALQARSGPLRAPCRSLPVERHATISPWFPPVSSALRDPTAACGSGGISIERLLAAYRRGTSPGHGASRPWWSPIAQRTHPQELRWLAQSSQRLRNRGTVPPSNTAFRRGVAACAEPRASGRT